MTNEEFIQQHQSDDVRALVLRSVPRGVDIQWCAQQIEGYQTAQRKLPHWAATPGLHYPPRLSMEQCSSWDTALYKRSIIEMLMPAAQRHHLVDLTGGLAVDFSALAPLFTQATYVERLPHLCQLATHNLPLLGLPQAKVLNTDSPDPALWQRTNVTLFLDPARRDGAGRKTVALEDCTPNILELQPHWQAVPYIIIKLSPMLDIAATLRQVQGVSQVHAVSVKSECKELLLVVQPLFEGQPTIHAANILPDVQGAMQTAMFHALASQRAVVNFPLAPATLPVGALLFEPGASLLKAQLQDAFAMEHGLSKLHPMSNLFLASATVDAESLRLHGRVFTLQQQFDFSKATLRKIKELRQANLTVRNFPGTVEALRRRLCLADGGQHYLFATTLADASHALLLCSKA